MKRPLFINFLYALFFFFYIGLVFYGKAYYLAPIAQKVRHPLHPLLRQSGSWGHLLGILGSLFMVLLLLYSIRKRFRFARNWGNLNTWLEMHIFLGITGPLLVLLHTVFKFSGIVSIAFWSMVLVVMSGLIGKYIYELIPHSLSGMELNRIELEAEEIGLTFEMRKLIPARHPFWKHLLEIENKTHSPTALEPLLLFLEPFKIRRRLARILNDTTGLHGKKRRQLLSLVVKRHMIHRKTALLRQTLKIIHYWHLLHQPFVIIMFLILLVHIYIAARMGYLWIF
jgi:hypothetical protein